MKIVLDLTRLVAEGKLTPAQAEQLKTLASSDTGALAINILLSFGAIAVATGVIVLAPAATTGVLLGIAMVAGGLTVSHRLAAHWGLLGTAMVIIGALALSGGVVGLAEGRVLGFLLAATLLLALAAAVRSGLLAALARRSRSRPSRSSRSRPLPPPPTWSRSACRRPMKGLALTFARVSLLLVNFGFWVGSLWGDRPGRSWRRLDPAMADADWVRAHYAALRIPDVVFVVAWTAALAAGSSASAPTR